MTGVDNIIPLGQHTWWDDIGRGLSSYPLDNTHGRPKLGMTCHHRPWTAHTDGQCQVLIAKKVLGLHRWSDNIGHGKPSWPWDSAQNRTTSDVACHHSPNTKHTIGRHLVWRDIIALGRLTRSDDVRNVIPSSPYYRTHEQTKLSVAFHYLSWTVQRSDEVRHYMPA